MESDREGSSQTWEQPTSNLVFNEEGFQIAGFVETLKNWGCLGGLESVD